MINATEALPLNNVKTVVIYKLLSSSVKPVIQDDTMVLVVFCHSSFTVIEPVWFQR